MNDMKWHKKKHFFYLCVTCKLNKFLGIQNIYGTKIRKKKNTK